MDTPPLPRRKSIRLPAYDYAQNGAYFVTVCLKPRLPLLGRIAEADVGAGPRPARTLLSPLGAIVEHTWTDLPKHNPGLVLGPFVVMPDHIHGILILEGRAGLGPARLPRFRNLCGSLRGSPPAGRTSCGVRRAPPSGSAATTITSSAISRTLTRPPPIFWAIPPGGRRKGLCNAGRQGGAFQRRLRAPAAPGPFVSRP